jgi:hypothetical protein
MEFEIPPPGAERPAYFSGLGAERQALLWASAVRVRLTSWERIVALHLAVEIYRHSPPDERPEIQRRDYWRGQVEHHLLVVAAAHMLRSMTLLEKPPLVPALVRKELIAVRDLLEHWDENMPVFNVQPRPREPKYPSGKGFAARNPVAGPYDWWTWESQRGAMVTPQVSGPEVRAIADAVIRRVLDTRPGLEEFVEPDGVSPWIDASGSDGWWPRNPRTDNQEARQ